MKVLDFFPVQHSQNKAESTAIIDFSFN